MRLSCGTATRANVRNSYDAILFTEFRSVLGNHTRKWSAPLPGHRLSMGRLSIRLTRFVLGFQAAFGSIGQPLANRDGG